MPLFIRLLSKPFFRIVLPIFAGFMARFVPNLLVNHPFVSAFVTAIAFFLSFGRRRMVAIWAVKMFSSAYFWLISFRFLHFLA
ncbi:MAG: hypothetical protein K5945_05610 [Bacteroidaceae bacterium]|nr:hypothetical protein [Bacteroidaceae bacterium]